MTPHRTDRLSLGFGLFFLLVVLWWLLDSQINVHLPTAGWFVAGGLILFGVLGLFGSLRPRQGEPAPASEPVSTPPAPAEEWS